MNDTRSLSDRARAAQLRILSALISFALLAPPVFARNAQKALQDDNIREAIVRYQIKMWDLKAEVYFLEISGKDPSNEFLKRFVDLNLPVRKKSASTRKKDVLGWVIEKKTHKLGVIFDQSTIRWASDVEVVVDGGYSCAGLCAAGGTYRVEYLEGKWVVKGFKATFMS